MEFIFSVGNIIARIRASERMRDGGIRAAVDFLRDGAGVFTHRAVWTDAVERGAVAEKLASLTGLDERLLADELLRMEASIATQTETQGTAPILENAVSWPEPPGASAFTGLAGRVVEAADPHTEADRVAVLVNFIVAFGNAAGIRPHYQVGATRHGLNLFAVLVGDTAKARKGDSWSPVELLFRRSLPQWADNRIRSGLSSGEGLIWQVRDPIERLEPIKEKGRVVDYQKVIADTGVDDKRLLLVEPEFARVLNVMTRSGNTLSPVIRQAWDKRNLDSLTKNSPARATGALISIIGHITVEELQRELGDVEIANGFANRFIWFAVKRSKLLPTPTPFDGPAVDELLQEVGRRVEASQSLAELQLSSSAKDLWVAMYPSLSAARPGLAGAILARAEAQTIRLAALYALMDRLAQISTSHLAAAAELWAYSERSSEYIWAGKLGDPVADSIATALRSNGRMTRSQIRDLLGRHVNASRIDAALQLLLQIGKARTYREESGGRPVEVWEAAA